MTCNGRLSLAATRSVKPAITRPSLPRCRRSVLIFPLVLDHLEIQVGSRHETIFLQLVNVPPQLLVALFVVRIYLCQALFVGMARRARMPSSNDLLAHSWPIVKETLRIFLWWAVGFWDLGPSLGHVFERHRQLLTGNGRLVILVAHVGKVGLLLRPRELDNYE